MGNKAERFVEDRKKALQSYLRSIVNYLVTNIVSLSCSPDKETLLNLLPFFGDNISTGSEPQPSLSIFSRRRRPDQQQGPQLVLWLTQYLLCVVDVKPFQWPTITYRMWKIFQLTVFFYILFSQTTFQAKVIISWPGKLSKKIKSKNNINSMKWKMQK